MSSGLLDPPDVPDEDPFEWEDVEPDTFAFVTGSPSGENRLGLVLKRTYVIGEDGTCELAVEDQQEVVIDEECVYEEVEPPRVSPVMFADDSLAFRDRTDLVIQGSAHAYEGPVTRTQVAVRFRDWARVVDVHGDRVVELKNGRLRFGDPEPFTEMPIRYDRAYGGVDETALRNSATAFFHELAAAAPELGLDTGTPFHYPRNPAGRGFLIEIDDEGIRGLVAPNLEYTPDPVTPERLAVGHPDRWPEAPLPAALDWQSASWFPRVAYLGAPFFHEQPPPRVLEVEFGWAAHDLFAIPWLMDQLDRPIRQEFTQAASPGMCFDDFAPDETLEILNLHPERPVFILRLPGEVPDVQLRLPRAGDVRLRPHLNAVVVRPDLGELVMIWRADTPVDRTYAPDQIDALPCTTIWKRPAS